MQYAFLLGRVIFSIFFLHSAFNHFKNAGSMAGYAAAKGVPAPKLAILGSGALLLIGGASILLGAYPLIGIIALALFLLPVSFTMHNYWAATDPMQQMNDRVNFWKNMTLLGALLMFVAIPQPWPFSVVL
jgi:putative oxidoreductase